MNDLLNSATEPNALAAANMIRYLNAQPMLASNLPTATKEQQKLFDALAEDFYALPVKLTVGNMTIELYMSAAVASGLEDCLLYIIDQQ